MSRSYRKNFITQQSYRSKTPSFFKRLANRKARKDPDLPNGNGYRKVYETWNICDYKSEIDVLAWWMKDEPWKVISK
jgi:hypothetical protein